jgi:putative exosortase-associated protein (TIGR04073 family)
VLQEYRPNRFQSKGDFMRSFVIALILLTAMSFASSAFAQETQRSEVIVEKMAFKFVRGVTNAATSIVELPKQSYLTIRDRGAVGYVIGPLKGIGMTIYRAFTGVVETTFFLVPQPGYYDSMISPDFVWKGWEDVRPVQSGGMESETAEPVEGSKEK